MKQEISSCTSANTKVNEPGRAALFWQPLVSSHALLLALVHLVSKALAGRNAPVIPKQKLKDRLGWFPGISAGYGCHLLTRPKHHQKSLEDLKLHLTSAEALVTIGQRGASNHHPGTSNSVRQYASHNRLQRGLEVPSTCQTYHFRNQFRTTTGASPTDLHMFWIISLGFERPNVQKKKHCIGCPHYTSNLRRAP